MAGMTRGTRGICTGGGAVLALVTLVGCAQSGQNNQQTTQPAATPVQAAANAAGSVVNAATGAVNGAVNGAQLNRQRFLASARPRTAARRSQQRCCRVQLPDRAVRAPA